MIGVENWFPAPIFLFNRFEVHAVLRAYNDHICFSIIKDQGNDQMKISPLHDRVVIRRNEEESTTAGGIVLPGAAAEKPNQGEVVAVGEGRTLNNGELQALTVKVGDTVLFGGYAGSNTVKVDGEELLIMSESEIYGVLED